MLNASKNHPIAAKPIKLAILAMHPVQYHSPLYRSICDSPAFDGTVLYLDTLGLKGIYEKEFGTKIEWDMPLLEGHRHEFIKNISPNNESGILSRVNPGLPAALSRGSYDAVLIQGYSILSMWIALFSARWLGTRIIWRGEVTLKPHQSPGGLRNKVRDLMIRAFLSRCDAVLFTCASNKDFLVHQGLREENLFPFLCAVDNEHFRRQAEKYEPQVAHIRKELRIPKENLVILFCGRLTARKRSMDVLQAIRRAGHERFSFVIMGDGPQREQLLSFARESNIHAVHLGFVNQSEISRYYAIADIFCLLSEYDPSPKALNEAMNFSLVPIVSKTIGTSHDLIIEGKTGFCVELGDVDATARHLEWLRENPVHRRQIALAAVDQVAHFSFAANVSGLQEACRCALQQ